ncbi:MAG: hypothetical protein RBT63_00570 [Bdellovibrionales bacterium]|jgi:predicted small lipoprotein YifL|nr:hypothetical protein [Bdellovibrionales bacterium]
MFKSVVSFYMLIAVTVALTACSSKGPKEVSPEELESALDRAASRLSLQELDQAALVFRVAFDKALDSWGGPTDQAVPGCRITGKEAENGLAAIRPWRDRRALEQAELLLASPKSYKLPVNVETCERDCSCSVGLAVYEAAELDKKSHAKVRELKRMRSRLEAKSELISSERAELCAEGVTWICQSDLLKALKATTAEATSGVIGSPKKGSAN